VVVALTRKTNQAGRLTTPSGTSVEPTTILWIDRKSATIHEIQRSQNHHAVRSAGRPIV
jgi:hypothetical protein